VDEETLRRVAAFTRGKYFRATDTEGLLAIYREIDQMEKCRIELAGTVKRDEWFVWPLLAGFVVLALEGLLGATRFLVVG
jgi:Ca-activated chloride channel family protein